MKGYDAVRAVDEASMIQELVDLHLIAVSDKEGHVPVGPIDVRAATGVSVRSSGETHYVPVPMDFITLARGHRYWTEVVTRLLAWFLTALVAALLGALLTLWIVGG